MTLVIGLRVRSAAVLKGTRLNGRLVGRHTVDWSAAVGDLHGDLQIAAPIAQPVPGHAARAEQTVQLDLVTVVTKSAAFALIQLAVI